MPTPSLPHLTSKAAVTAACAGVLTFAVGCDNLQSARGATSIFALVPQTSPDDAARLALDPYNADNRYRGVTLLADADFGGAEVYLRLYEDATGDEDAGVRQAGVRALGLHGGPEHVELITPYLTDDDPLVRATTARALQRLHNDRAVRPLIAVLSEDAEREPEVRAEAAHALGQYRETRVLDALINALADPSLAVNTATLDSLETLTGQNFGLDRRA
ncbi:MAG: HEAT repeat domain-containing protein, partial [Planctomycetota bacterium]